MLYTILWIGAVVIMIVLGRIGVEALSNAGERKDTRALERKISTYENFLMRLGSGSVGNPELEAQVILEEQNRKELH